MTNIKGGVTGELTHMFDNITSDNHNNSYNDKGSTIVKEAGKKGGKARKEQIEKDRIGVMKIRKNWWISNT